MVHPWRGPRHRSWASDTAVTAVLFVILLAATIWTDMNNGPAEPPAYLTGLLGAAGAALFGATAADKRKREDDVQQTAGDAQQSANTAKRRTMSLNEDQIRMERRIEWLTRLAKEQHPNAEIPEPSMPDLPPLDQEDRDGP